MWMTGKSNATTSLTGQSTRPTTRCTRQPTRVFLDCSRTRSQRASWKSCLSPNFYCILSHKADGWTLTSTRAKGISRREVERMTIDQYRVQITDPHLTYIQNHRIFSYRHSIDSRTIRKAGLVGYDTKRVLCADKINSLAFGHYSIQVAHLYDAPTAQGHDLVLRWEERAATAPSTKH